MDEDDWTEVSDFDSEDENLEASNQRKRSRKRRKKIKEKLSLTDAVLEIIKEDHEEADIEITGSRNKLGDYVAR